MFNTFCPDPRCIRQETVIPTITRFTVGLDLSVINFLSFLHFLLDLIETLEYPPRNPDDTFLEKVNPVACQHVLPSVGCQNVPHFSLSGRNVEIHHTRDGAEIHRSASTSGELFPFLHDSISGTQREETGRT